MVPIKLVFEWDGVSPVSLVVADLLQVKFSLVVGGGLGRGVCPGHFHTF